jgi:hypothetical protein
MAVKAGEMPEIPEVPEMPEVPEGGRGRGIVECGNVRKSGAVSGFHI